MKSQHGGGIVSTVPEGITPTLNIGLAESGVVQNYQAEYSKEEKE